MINVKDIKIRDPFILFDDGYYYLFGTIVDSEIPCFKGYRSIDLVNFEEPKVIFQMSEGFWATKDYWAPEVHKYKGKYYLFASLKSDDKCRATQIFISDTPLGEYKPLTEEPITPTNWECLDGTLYIDNEKPYLIFCREWLEVNDGEMYIAELSDDLKSLISEPILLFRASEAKWVKGLNKDGGYVTDGPYIIKEKDTYYMIWSSFSKNGYALGICHSKTLLGPWIQLDEPIYDFDGGHAMIFNKDNERMVVFHTPNDPRGSERLKVIPLRDLISI